MCPCLKLSADDWRQIKKIRDARTVAGYGVLTRAPPSPARSCRPAPRSQAGLAARRTSLAHCLVPSSRRSRTYCTTQSLPPQASSARSVQVARGPGLPILQMSKKSALEKKE